MSTTKHQSISKTYYKYMIKKLQYFIIQYITLQKWDKRYNSTSIIQNTADKEIWNTCASVILQMIAVLEFPPRAGCNILVSLLSRYGTCPLQMKFITKVVMKNIRTGRIASQKVNNLPLTLNAFTKFLYYRTKSHETFVNMRTLLKSHTLCTSLCSAFWAS